MDKLDELRYTAQIDMDNLMMDYMQTVINKNGLIKEYNEYLFRSKMLNEVADCIRNLENNRNTPDRERTKGRAQAYLDMCLELRYIPQCTYDVFSKYVK